MITKDKLIFSIKEGHIDIAQVSNWFGSVKLKKVISLPIDSVLQGNAAALNSDINVMKIKASLKNNNIKIKKAHIILALEGIITRLIEIPYMKKNDVEKFIENNIEDYFTVNINEYYFDYKIIDIDKNESKKINILLVVMPRNKVQDIAWFIEGCGLTLGSITIYPDAIANLFSHMKEDSIAIFDVGEDRNNVTILEKGRIFLYSSMAAENYEDKDEKYNELLDSMGYFLNFYSSRHYGNKIDLINIIGSLNEDKTIYKRVKEQFEIDTILGLSGTKVNVSSNQHIDVDRFSDIIGNCIYTGNIHSKAIDFAKASKVKKEFTSRQLIAVISGVLLGMTILWSLASLIYFSAGKSLYNKGALNNKLNSLSYVEKSIQDLNTEKKLYEDKIQAAKSIENEKYDYVSILEALKKGLPSQVSISNIKMDKEHVVLNLNIPKDTMEIPKVVVALNHMGIFEPIQVQTVNLDNSQDSISFDLTPKSNIK